MKYLLSALTWFKYVLIPPFGALLIWFMTSFSSSMTRYVLPYLGNLVAYLYSKCGEYILTDGMQGTGAQNKVYWAVYNGMVSCVNMVGNLVYGLNAWVDVGLIVNTLVTLLIIEMSYLALRFVLKLITVGQI